MTDAPSARPVARPDQQLVELVEVWRRACTDFVNLVRDLRAEQGDLPTDLAGWSVRDVVAHTAHLEAVLAGSPEETVHVEEAPHLVGMMSYYTEQGVLARRARDLGSLADEIERAVATRHAALLVDPPTDPSGAAPKTPGDIGWDLGTLLSNRPLDVWVHEQDIRRAINRPGGYDSPAAAHTLRVFGRALPMIVGKRVKPAPGALIRLVVPEAGLSWTVQVGEDGRAVQVDGNDATTTTVTLTSEDFVVLAGGRRTSEHTQPSIEGDADLGRRLVDSLGVTP